MHSPSFKLVLVFVLVVCVGSVLPVWSQSTSSGVVAGSVTDQSNAMVPSATVTLTDAATNIARTTTTNKEGRYVFVDVNPGIYSVSISKSGFAVTKTENQEVKVGAALTLNLSLQVGGANVVVEVQATGAELQTMNATVGNTVTSLAIDNLPALGRDVATFVTLQPGVGTNGAVAGTFQDQSYFSLDGGDNTNDLDGSGSIYTGMLGVGDPTGGAGDNFFAIAGPSGVMPTPQDSVEEFKVNTAGQTADFNSSGGAEIKVVTKRGTNAYHGTGYEYYKDNNWSGNSWQNTFFGIARPSFHYSRFGGAIGGPLIPTRLFDTKTFVFFNYEGFRFPNSETIDRNVPSPALLAGNITDPVTGTVTSLKSVDPEGLGLNPIVSQIWNTFEPAGNTGTGLGSCPGPQSLCDGFNVLGFSGNLSLPTTSKIAVARIDHDFSAKEHFMASWRYYNVKAATGDQVDIGGAFTGDKLGVPASVSSDPIQDWYLVAGLTSNITNNTTNDLHYSWLRNWWAWARQGGPVENCPLCAGLGGALELMSGEGDGAAQNLGPYNVNNQQIRTRFWDGHDGMLRDDLSILKGNHLFQVGGIYQHNFNWHQRNDGGGTINEFPVYSLGNGTAHPLSSELAPCNNTHLENGTPTPNIANCDALTSAALGIVSVANQAFTRSGTNLALNAPLTPAFDQSTIPYYNVYFSDTWHMKPTVSLTYGLGWALEMPPVEANGKQIEMVDQSNQLISVNSYLATRKRMALAGQVYNPEIGFATVGNTENGLKYPYNPYYGEFSPRVALAWSPHFDSDSPMGKVFGHEDTVIRGGYGRQYGRLNGVTQVLIPLLGLGLIQQTQCVNNLAAAGPVGQYSGSGSCGGQGSVSPSTAFRVGTAASTTGGPIAPIPVPTLTLPQPDYPGFNNTSTADASTLDPNFRPSAIDSFDLTIQRQLTRKVSLEVGYIGRRITHEFQPMAMNVVPYMMTLGGQQFKNAYANLVLQYCGGTAGLAGGGCGGATGPAAINSITAQPFFEAALGGAGSAYCSTGVTMNGATVTPTNCTQAVALNEGNNVINPAPGNSNFGSTNLNNAQVWSLWSDLDNGAFTFPRSMMNTPIPASVSPIFGAGGQTSSGVQIDASQGWANYSGGFASLKMADWRGMTAQSNFTWAKALGTGSIYQAVSQAAPTDSFNLGESYGRQTFDRKFTYNAFLIYQPPFFKGQAGPMGRLLGGWTFAGVFTAGSGTPVQTQTTFGAAQEFGSADDVNFATFANAVPFKSETHEHANYFSSTNPLAGNSLPVNAFKNGVADANNWRNPILGIDNKDCGAGCFSGLPYWNLDFSVKKSVLVAEGVNIELQGVFTNILNHNQWLDGFPALFNTAGWGSLAGEAGARNIEVGLRFRF